MFKIGDRVYHSIIEEYGTIVIIDDVAPKLGVGFEKMSIDRSTLRNTLPSRSGLWCYEEELVPAEIVNSPLWEVLDEV